MAKDNTSARILDALNPQHLHDAVRDGRIRHCARCRQTPRRFAAVAWYVPHDPSKPPVGYGICGPCGRIVRGYYGKAAKAEALRQIEACLERETAAVKL